MNLETMPSTPFTIQKDGYLPVEWQNWFSMNSQNMELFFANVGHLLPSRTNTDIQSLSTAGLTDPALFKARSLYNDDTNNFMGNINGQYLNYTMNNLSTRSSILSMSPQADTIQYFGDENNNLYSNVNANTAQIPQNTTPSNSVLNFSTNGGNLYATINGVTKQVTLT